MARPDLSGPSAHPADDLRAFFDRIGGGSSVRGACVASGLPRRSVLRWLESARDEEDPASDVAAFARVYELERQKWVSELEQAMSFHFPSDWRAVAAALKVADRERWGDGVSESDAQQITSLKRRAAKAEAELAEVKLALARVELADRTPRGE